jgi:membrane-associated phospholipid phosphatase
MFRFFKRFLSVLALTMFITISINAQSITQAGREKVVVRESHTPLSAANVGGFESGLMLKSVTDAATIVSGHALDKMTYDSYLDLNKNTLKVASTLNRKFNAQQNSQTGYLESNPPTFQKNLFISDVSLKSVAFRRSVIAPALFIAAGLSTLDEDNDDNYEVQEERNRHIPNFRYRVDDYLQHSPIIVVYGLNLLGVEGKNDFANRTALLLKSEAMVGILTFSLKRITAVPRPDTKELTSFPSGHTAQAFAAATFMHKEYGHKSIWYSVGAYTVATGVGAMRVMNNRHWVSDVLVGAGIGILSTNLVYLTHQYRWGKKNKGSQTTVMPSYDGQTGMVNIIHRIN